MKQYAAAVATVTSYYILLWRKAFVQFLSSLSNTASSRLVCSEPLLITIHEDLVRFVTDEHCIHKQFKYSSKFKAGLDNISFISLQFYVHGVAFKAEYGCRCYLWEYCIVSYLPNIALKHYVCCLRLLCYPPCQKSFDGYAGTASLTPPRLSRRFEGNLRIIALLLFAQLYRGVHCLHTEIFTMAFPLVRTGSSPVTILVAIYKCLAIISVVLQVWSRSIQWTTVVINALAIIAAFVEFPKYTWWPLTKLTYEPLSRCL